MARKLGLGMGVICTCVALAGCQSGAGSRVAGTNQNRAPSGAFAKQGTTMPPPNFPNANQNGGFSTSTNGAFPTAPNNNPNNPGFVPQNLTPINATNNPPGASPQGPQGIGTPTTSNRNNVQITTPGTPNLPPPPAQPGISQIPPLP